MKVRLDYVTNSSSSIFIIVAKLRDYEGLVDHIRREYGEHGLSLLERNVVTGKTVKEANEYDIRYLEYLEDCKKKGKEICDDDRYINAVDCYWTTGEWEGGKDLWIFERIPDEFKEEVFLGEPI